MSIVHGRTYGIKYFFLSFYKAIYCQPINPFSCTVATAEILSGKNGRAWVPMVLHLRKYAKIKILKRKKISWEPFRSCLLNSTANPAQFG